MAEPAITLKAIHDSGYGNLIPTRVVIHSTCPSLGYPHASAPGQAHNTARYFQNPNAGGSAHYVVDIADEHHCVTDSVVSWHAPPNERSIGIEICSEGGDYPLSYTREQWLSDAVAPALHRAAHRTAELCARFGIPPVKIGPSQLAAGAHGVCGHVDVSRAWRQSDHSDPGPGFPWPEFMDLVTEAMRSGGDDDMTPDELRRIVCDELRKALAGEMRFKGRNIADMGIQAVDSGLDIQKRLIAVEATLTAIKEELAKLVKPS